MVYVVGIFISMLVFGLIIYCITGFVCHMFKKDNNPVSPFKVFCIVDFMVALVFLLLAVGLSTVGNSNFGIAFLACFLFMFAEPALGILFIFSMIFGFVDRNKSAKRRRSIEEKSKMLREKHNAIRDKGENNFAEEIINDNQLNDLINQIELKTSTEDE